MVQKDGRLIWLNIIYGWKAWLVELFKQLKSFSGLYGRKTQLNGLDTWLNGLYRRDACLVVGLIAQFMLCRLFDWLSGLVYYHSNILMVIFAQSQGHSGTLDILTIDQFQCHDNFVLNFITPLALWFASQTLSTTSRLV